MMHMRLKTTIGDTWLRLRASQPYNETDSENN